MILGGDTGLNVFYSEEKDRVWHEAHYDNHTRLFVGDSNTKSCMCDT